MESLSNAIRTAMQPSTPPRPEKIPCARDIMATDLLVFHPDQPVREVIRMLLERGVSGGPVIGPHRELLGMISEGDCLRALASGAYDGQPAEADRLVRDLMTPPLVTIEPAMDVYAVAHALVETTNRRLPVIQDGKVIGQVSRRDVLRAIDKHL